MKLLICDDDISTIDVIQNKIDWERLGISRILRAYNGIVGKELIEKERPELILCDIGMPQCNGIEVLRYTYEQNIQACFTFLSCYENFEYAREAVRYGAMNYLTKPFDLEELFHALERMVAVAKAKKDALNAQGNSSGQNAWVNSALRSVRDGLFGEDGAKIDAMFRKEGVDIKADSKWRLVSITADMKAAVEHGWEKELLRYSFRYLAQEAVADRLDLFYMLADGDEQLEILSLFIKSSDFSEAELEQRCRKFISVCETFVKMAPVCIVGDEIELCSLSVYAQALKNRAHRLRLLKSKAFLYKNTNQTEEIEATALDEITVLTYVKQRDKDSFMAAVSREADKITQGRTDSDKHIALLHHDLLNCFYSCLRDNRIQAHQIFKNDILQQLDKNAERSVFDMISFASYLFDQAVCAIQALDGTSIVLTNVKQYIKEHFRENIDRNDVAGIAYITPNYLSKKFHSETGLTLREYINRLRIEEAKRLLLTTGLTVSDIASNVGFDNISYFSTVFRKFCGVSPIDWRNNSMSDDAQTSACNKEGTT